MYIPSIEGDVFFFFYKNYVWKIVNALKKKVDEKMFGKKITEGETSDFLHVKNLIELLKIIIQSIKTWQITETNIRLEMLIPYTYKAIKFSYNTKVCTHFLQKKFLPTKIIKCFINVERFVNNISI